MKNRETAGYSCIPTPLGAMGVYVAIADKDPLMFGFGFLAFIFGLGISMQQ